MYDLAVIGAGGAGQMAVLRGVLNHLKTLVFLGDVKTTRKSRAAWVAEVENIPGMFDKKRPITATTREVLQFIESKEDLKRFLTPVKKAADSIVKKDEVFVISDGGTTYEAKYVVLCTGTMDVQPVIGDSIEPIFPFANREDVLYCIRCDGHKVVGKECAVIGHGSGAGWIAVMLKERYDLPKITVLSHGKPFEGSEEVGALLAKYQIEIIEDEITGVLGDSKTGLEGFKLGEKELKVPKAFVSLGSIAYNDLAKQLGVKMSEREHILANEKGETSVSGFYAAGDLVQGKKKQVYTAWDMAVDAVDDIDRRIREEKRTQAH